MTMGLGL